MEDVTEAGREKFPGSQGLGKWRLRRLSGASRANQEREARRKLKTVLRRKWAGGGRGPAVHLARSPQKGWRM
jgi:hypothetical protein